MNHRKFSSSMRLIRSLGMMFITFMLASIAKAELVQVEYLSSNGQRTVSASKEIFINPKGDLSVYLSAGVDRTLKARLLTSSGSVVAEPEFIE
ncbi:DUF4165 domain-containing protein [Pseudomonas veronii]|uniref:DUF4165 domain-containing protein n=1 Tax=Pseudomonas veronii TaxID=76761 RepID=UPI00398883D3